MDNDNNKNTNLTKTPQETTSSVSMETTIEQSVSGSQTGAAAQSVETPTMVAEVTEAVSCMKVRMERMTKLKASQRRKLKKLRAMGVDTSKILVPRNVPFDISCVTPNQPVKRTVTQRNTPDETLVKKQKTKEDKPSYSGVLSGIRAAVVLTTYPEGQMTLEDAREVGRLLAVAIDRDCDREELPAPRFEGSRWMGEYQGYICADEASFFYLKTVMEAAGKYKVYQAKDLPPKTKVLAVFPEVAPEKTVFKRLEFQNSGLSCKKWKILRSKVDEKGYHMVIAIDNVTKTILEKVQYRPYYLGIRVHFKLLEERRTTPEVSSESMETAEPAEDQDGFASSSGQPPAQ